MAARTRNASGTDKHNDLLAVARFSMIACRRHMSTYSHAKSKHTFTQAQLMSCLILKAYLNLTYRRIVQVLALSDQLREAMGLSRVPVHTTLKMFADRAATPALLDGIIGQVRCSRCASRVAWRCRRSRSIPPASSVPRPASITRC